jgi:hypothetical protein
VFIIGALDVNIEQLVGLVIGGLILASITAGIGILLVIKKQTADLYDAHLGPRAIDSEGLPRWYVREAHFTEALERICECIASVQRTLASLEAVNRGLLEELRIDKAKRAATEKARGVGHNSK